MSTGKDKSHLVHREAAELLPWYANGTLDPQDEARVRAHLASCAECQRDLASLEAMSRAVADSSAEIPPASANLRVRTMDRIERFEAERPRTPGQALRQFFSTLRQALLSVSVPARLALAGQLAVMILLAVGVVAFARQSSRQQTLAANERKRADEIAAELKEQEKKYQTLADECPETPTTGAVKIKVVFQESASQKQVRELLSKLSAVIVDGPTAQRFYTISIRAEAGQDRHRIEADALREMRNRPDVVQFPGD